MKSILRRNEFAFDLPPGMAHFHILDTALASDNLGDEIIMEAAMAALRSALPNAYLTTSSSHDGLGPNGRYFAKQAQAVLLLGTNALTAKAQLGRRDVWPVTRQDAAAMAGKLVLCGVGARESFATLAPRQARFLSALLAPHYVQSVRDNSALAILSALNVPGRNTSCPTLWRWLDLPPTEMTPGAETAVFTLTNRKADPTDKTLIATLCARYKRVAFWPQQLRDIAYLRALDIGAEIEILPPNLAAYRRFLRETAADYIGTRLHAGIDALHQGNRAVIVEIDNRSEELGATNALPTLKRAAIAADLSGRLSQAETLNIRLDRAAIQAFLSQFTPSESKTGTDG